MGFELGQTRVFGRSGFNINFSQDSLKKFSVRNVTLHFRKDFFHERISLSPCAFERWYRFDGTSAIEYNVASPRNGPNDSINERRIEVH